MKIKPKTILDFDVINSIDIYYEPMQISGDDKSRRRALAEYLIDAFLFFFATFEVHTDHKGVLTQQLYAQLLADKISEAVTKVTGIDSYMSDHIKELSKQVVATTFEKTANSDGTVPPRPSDFPFTPSPSDGLVNSDNEPKEEPRSDYWLSYRRAEDIAKSEANTFLNYTDYLDAKESGKTKKTWLTMLDDKVRGTHTEVEGRTIDIDESFVVGNSLMKFPHDLSESPDPKEVINCRCSVEYK